MLTRLRSSTAGSRIFVTLMAGRLTYRLAMYAAGLVLLAAWGSGEFARYAAATGAVGWLFALTSSGPEKAALTFVPATGGAVLERFFIRLALLPFGVLLLGWVATVVASVPAGVQLYAAAAAMTSGVGCTAVLVALYRIREQPIADVSSYAAIATSYGLVVGLTLWADLSVHGVLAVLVGLVALVNTVLLTRLFRSTRPTGAPVTLRRAALRASAVLGISELLGTASASVLYAILAINGNDRQISLFYVLMVVAGSIAVGWSYFLRLVQPRVVGWVERSGAAAGRAAVRRLTGAALGVGVPATIAVVVAAAALGSGLPVAAAALGLEILLYAAGAGAAVMLETVDARGRHGSATGAAFQFAAVALAGWWLVPAAGAAGAFAALCVGEVLRTAVLRRVALPILQEKIAVVQQQQIVGEKQ